MTITGKLDPSRLAFFSRPKTDTEAKIKISINGKDESLRVWCTTRGDASRRSNAIKLKDEISATSDVPQRDISISQSKDLISSVLDLCEISQINDTKTGVVRFEEKGLTPEEKAKRAPRSIDGERARAIFHPDPTKSEQVEQHHEFLEKFMKGMNKSATNGALQKINEKYPQLLEQKREGTADWVSKEGSPEYKAFEAYRNEVENIFFGAIGLEPLAPPPPLKDPVSPISMDPKISIDPINAELINVELKPAEITPITTPPLTPTEIPTIKFDPPPPLKDPVSPISMDPKISIDPINAELTNVELKPAEITPVTTPPLTPTEIPTIKFDPPPPPNLIQREEPVNTPPPPPSGDDNPPSPSDSFSSNSSSVTTNNDNRHYNNSDDHSVTNNYYDNRVIKNYYVTHKHHKKHVHSDTPPGGNKVDDNVPPPGNKTKVSDDVQTTVAKFEGPVIDFREKGLVDNANIHLRNLAANPAFKAAIGDSIEDFAAKNIAGYAGLSSGDKERIHKAIAATIMSIHGSSKPPGVNLDALGPQVLKTTLLVSASRAKHMKKLGSMQISNHPPKEGQEHCTGFIRNIYADFIKAFPTGGKEAATGASKLLEECMSRAGFDAKDVSTLHEKLNKSGREVLKYAEGDDMMDILKSMRDTLREDNDPKLKKLERKLADEIDKSSQLKRDDNLPMLISKLPFGKRPKVGKAFKKLEIALNGHYSPRAVDKLFQNIDRAVEQAAKQNNESIKASGERLEALVKEHALPLYEFVAHVNEQLPHTSQDKNVQELRAKILKPIIKHIEDDIKTSQQHMCAFKDGIDSRKIYGNPEVQKFCLAHGTEFQKEHNLSTPDINVFDIQILSTSASEKQQLTRIENADYNGMPLYANFGFNPMQIVIVSDEASKQSFDAIVGDYSKKELPSGKSSNPQQHMGDFLSKVKNRVTEYTPFRKNVHKTNANNGLPLSYNLPETARYFALANKGPVLVESGPQQFSFAIRNIMHRAKPSEGEGQLSLGDTLNKLDPSLKDTAITILKQDAAHNPHPELTEKAIEFAYLGDRNKLREHCKGLEKDEANKLLETVAYLESGKDQVSKEEIGNRTQILSLATQADNPHPELTEKALEVLYDTTAAKSEEKYEGKDVYLGTVFEQYEKDHASDPKAVDDLMKTITYLSKDKNKA